MRIGLSSAPLLLAIPPVIPRFRARRYGVLVIVTKQMIPREALTTQPLIKGWVLPLPRCGYEGIGYRLDQRCAFFETAAARLPQNEEFR